MSVRMEMRVCLVAHEAKHLTDDFVYADQLAFLWSTPFVEGPHTVYDFGRTLSVLHCPRGCFARLLHVWFIAHEPSQAGPGVCDCCRNGLL